MDYDKTAMPANYDAGRSYSADVLDRWLGLLSRYIAKEEVAVVLDLGCGTGRFSEALSAHFDADVIGVDPSSKMLEKARQKSGNPRISYRQGKGEALPLEDASADMVFLSMVYHHLGDAAAVARECRRVLRPVGHVCLRNGTADQIEAYPYIDFFPGIRPIMSGKLTSSAAIQDTFAKAGFGSTVHQVVDHHLADNWLDYAEKQALRADSFLTALPDPAFESGLAALRRHAAHADPSQPVTMKIDVFVFRRCPDFRLPETA